MLDLGCGSGENIAPLLARGANVIALDLSPDLVELARQRIAISNQPGELTFVVGSAYEVPIPDGSVDAILCASLLHHLDIPRAMAEMKRLLRPGGAVIVKEPVRFSPAFGALRALFPDQKDISEDEHPLTPAEFTKMKEGWNASGERAFRLPTVALVEKVFGEKATFKVWPLDGWLLRNFTPLQHFATARVVKLQAA